MSEPVADASKEALEREIARLEAEYVAACDARDWLSCDSIAWDLAALRSQHEEQAHG